MTDREWLDDHVELYAIDGLPTDEHDEVQALLDQLDAESRIEYDDRVTDVRELMHDYARRYTRDAPATLRARVLADFDAGAGHRGDPPHQEPPTDLSSRRRHRMAVAVGAAAAVVAVLFGGGVLVGNSITPDEPSTTQQADAVAAVFSARDATLSVGDLNDSRGVLTVVSSKSRNQAVATVRNIDNPVPDDRTLQLWSMGSRPEPVSAGLLNGSAGSPILIDALDSTTAFAVTVEPKGGSTAPTTPVLGQVAV
ncbi:anti-sigma factor [Gordonia sp. HY002]|uniref:anti-sigma factor n=1 Tax=Gordonia zhenghanii TaxID=2911516 RepID=UPI001EF0B12E|nr:anti-sigma factor [Gordonia zhenghanii]MCF8568967.1 anti-sigma factor [Gordonia zhenghanii]MCF8607523.1 anti-sigma factor [Gordonia zhenghanii]